MLRFLFWRLLFFIPVLWIVATIVFFLVRLAPGGPFDEEKMPSEAVRKRLEAHYHFDAPLYEQYGRFLWGAVRGDLGVSPKKPSRTVAEWIGIYFPASFELGCYALLVALSVGMSAGLVAASKPNTKRDHVPMALAMVGICIPSFVLGPLLVLVFSLTLGWLPVQGWRTPADRILPAVTLGAAYAAYVARLTRGGMLEVMAQDFIRTARAKGLGETRIVLRHALRGGVQPVVAFLGPAAAGLLTGSFVVETIFQIPGLGREFIAAASNRDHAMVLGIVLFYATLILAFNLVVDVVQAWLDPRARAR